MNREVGPIKLDLELQGTIEHIARHVKGQFNGQETTAAHGNCRKTIPAHPLIHHQNNPNVPLQFSTQTRPTRPTPSTQNNNQERLQGLHDQTHPTSDLDLEPHSHRNLPMGRIPPDCTRGYTRGRNSLPALLTPPHTPRQNRHIP